MTSKLPNPSGKYSVGCVDILPKTGLDTILFRLYYPTHDFTPTDDNLASWVSDPEYIDGYCKFFKLKWSKWFLQKMIGNEKIPVYWQGPILSQKDNVEDRKFPVIVFSPGLGANRTGNSFLCYDLASYGFVVAAIEHRDLTSSATYYIDHQKPSEKNWIYILNFDNDDHRSKVLRNMQIMKRVEECSQCLEYLESLNRGKLTNILCDFDLKVFEGKIDLHQVVIAGHSTGAVTAVMALKENSRFKVGVFLDAWMVPIGYDVCESLYEKNFKQPMLFISSEEFQTKQTIAMIRRINVKNLETKKVLKFNGTVHQSFSDFSMILPSHISKLAGVVGSTDQLKVNKAITSTILQFIGNTFDSTFQGDIELNPDEFDFIENDIRIIVTECIDENEE